MPRRMQPHVARLPLLLGKVHADRAAAELGFVERFDGALRVALVVELDEAKAAVLRGAELLRHVDVANRAELLEDLLQLIGRRLVRKVSHDDGYPTPRIRWRSSFRE